MQFQSDPTPGQGGAQGCPVVVLAQLAVAIPMLVLAGLFAIDEIAATRASVTVPAEVVRISTVLGYARAGARMPSRDLHAPVLAFRTPDGRMVEVIARDFTKVPCCRAGEAVMVRFPPGAPERAKIRRWREAWLWPGVLGLGGLGVLASGLATWRIMRRRTTATPDRVAGGPVRRG
jgi:hypothetical protein